MLKIRKKEMDPPSGWVFTVENGFTIKEGTFDKLLVQIRRHFEVNGYAIPDNLPEVVENYICLQNPTSICHGEGPKRFFPSKREIEEGTRKLLAARAEMEKHEDPFVSAEEANERAKMCVECPMKRNQWGCFLCDELVKLVVKTYGRTTPYDKLTLGCGVCGCINSAQIHLKPIVLAKTAKVETVSDYPEIGCWKRKALETHYYGDNEREAEQDHSTGIHGADEQGGQAGQEPSIERGSGQGDLPETQTGRIPSGPTEGTDQEPARRESPVQPDRPEEPGT